MITRAARCLPRQGDDRREAGYSLIEVLVVLALLGLMVLVGLPAMQDWLERYHTRTAAQTLAADMQLQRMRAVSRNATHSIVFDAANGTYTLWEGDPVNGLTTQLSPAPITLPFGVTFTDPVDDPIELSWNGNDDVAVFHPDGAVNGRLAQEDEITMTNSIGDSFRVTINQVTGRVQVLEGAS
ncbi:MAG: GspH/FimT family protein [Acidobacteriota bacterium]|jgi:prepilin-type N-terminal cleavage/methylation domain-containing protein